MSVVVAVVVIVEIVAIVAYVYINIALNEWYAMHDDDAEWNVHCIDER